MMAQSISQHTPMLNYALDHARCGLPVFPCRLDKTPYPRADTDANGKKIEKTGGLYKATTDETTIRDWWARWPNAMIGLRMGKSSGLFAIDPDAPKESGGVDGRIELAKLEGLHGRLDTLTTNTPSGGNHKFFNWRDDRPVTNGEGDLKGLGINVRGEGGYVIVPPSVRADGRAYEYERSVQLIADAPEWLFDSISPKTPAIGGLDSPPLAPADDQCSITERALANVVQLKPATRNERTYCERAMVLEFDALAALSEGERNNALNITAMKLGQLIGPGRLSETEVRTRLFAAAMANGLVDDGKQAVLDTIDSGLAKGMQQPRVIPDRDDRGSNESDVERLNKIHAVLPIGGKTRVVTFGEMAEFPGRETIVMTQTISDFTALQNKYRHNMLDKKGEPVSVPLGTHWINSTHRRQFDGGMAFMPQQDAPVVGNRLNLFNGFGVKPNKPDGKSGAAGCRLFLDFMLDVICSGDEKTFDYLRKREATIVQKRIRSEIALGLRTEEEGCGKGFYEKTMGHLLGHHAMQVSNPKHIVGAFNPHLETLLRLTADEALFVGSHEHRNALFGLITEPKLTIEPKGCSLYTADSFLNLSITSNAAHFLPVSGTARRFLIPTVSTAHMQDFVYFTAIQSQLEDGGYEALLYHFLHEVDLTGFNVRLVPDTAALREQRDQSLAPLDAWWSELLETGTLMGADPVSPNRAVSNAYQRQIEVDGSYGTTQIRYINQLGIYDQARLIEPRLKNHIGDHKLSAHLIEMGGDNTKKVLRRRGWTFLPLSVCRATWEKRYPGWKWRDTEITEWRAEEADDVAAAHERDTAAPILEPAF
jgi:Bifunctional DNA primase/polymerase, N-terminal